LQGFASSQNNPLAMATVRHASQEADLPMVELEQGFKWGEDFGLFTQRYPGAMFGLGSGLETAALHNPDYDFPDALIGMGADLFFRIAQRYTNPI
jgi:metal-dependent amidase/aminoacylase/carboxypeptidase family protein